jgi:hypothetical protein
MPVFRVFRTVTSEYLVEADDQVAACQAMRDGRAVLQGHTRDTIGASLESEFQLQEKLERVYHEFREANPTWQQDDFGEFASDNTLRQVLEWAVPLGKFDMPEGWENETEDYFGLPEDEFFALIYRMNDILGVEN